MKEKRMILRRQVPENFTGGRWTYKTEEFQVIVMAVVGAHAMVRRPRCEPFIAKAKELFDA